MKPNLPRRGFLQASVAAAMIPAATTIAAEPKAINVVVWDERQPEQKQAYDNFLGNQIADHLKSKPGLSVKSVGIEDDEKGLSPGIIRSCDVLIWKPCMSEPVSTPSEVSSGTGRRWRSSTSHPRNATRFRKLGTG